MIARLLVGLVRGYQRLVSPLLPPACRFYPSCSAYAVGALERHGAARGSWLAVRRLARCHPFCEGGVEPVPDLVPNLVPEPGPGAAGFSPPHPGKGEAWNLITEGS